MREEKRGGGGGGGKKETRVSSTHTHTHTVCTEKKKKRKKSSSTSLSISSFLPYFFLSLTSTLPSMTDGSGATFFRSFSSRLFDWKKRLVMSAYHANDVERQRKRFTVCFFMIITCVSESDLSVHSKERKNILHLGRKVLKDTLAQRVRVRGTER